MFKRENSPLSGVSPQNRIKAEGILRESSPKQAQAHKQGLDQQSNEIAQFARELGAEIVRWETIVESASRWDRPVWETVIDGIIQRHLRSDNDAIIFDRVDRETRNLFASVPILDKALRAGIKVYFAADELELDPRNPEVTDQYLNKADEARSYAKAISKGWRRVHHNRARHGKHPTGQRLFGFRYDEDENRILDEALVPIAREAVKRVIREKLLSPVVRWLVDEQHVTALNSLGALRRWLENPALKGETHACGEVINHQALLSPEEWDEVQRILDDNKGKRTPRKGYLPIPFFCQCGARMRAERHDTRVYIRCRACCRKPYLRLDRFQSMLNLATLTYIGEKRHLFSDARVKAEIRARALASLDENRKAQNRLGTSWGAFLDQKMDWKGPRETLERKEQSLISQQATLEEEENHLLDQLVKLPKIEVVDIQEAWEEALKPYEVIFSGPFSPEPPKLDEQNPNELALKSLLETVPEFYKINNLRPPYPSRVSGDGVEVIPEPLAAQGTDIPSGWSDQGWQPPEQFKDVIKPPLEDSVWDFWKNLGAEAFLDDQGHTKLRFQLRVAPRRLNETPRSSSLVRPTHWIPFELTIEPARVHPEG
ncbi:hypothetical protein ES703_15124 [subsurface metagenome]